MIPLLEHNEPTSLLMGTNMLRQWIVPETPSLTSPEWQRTRYA